MKNYLSKIYLSTLLICLSIQIIYSQNSGQFSIDESPLPVPTSPVMDYAGVIDPNTKRNLERKIIEFKETSNPSVELAVAVVKTTNNRPIFDYSLAVARGWGIGSRNDDNPSALLFIAIEDRKYFTQISRDLEDELPDGLVGSLQRNYLVPQFKRGNYAKGIEDTIDAYIRTIKAKQSNEYVPVNNEEYTDPRDYEYNNFECDDLIICLVIIGIIVFIILAGSGGNGGGGRGGRGGKRRKRNSSSDAGDFLSGIATGILIDAITSGGGSSSSGGSSWGGGSSGGWGGFGGGGDFGGGGAGGGW